MSPARRPTPPAGRTPTGRASTPASTSGRPKPAASAKPERPAKPSTASAPRAAKGAKAPNATKSADGRATGTRRPAASGSTSKGAAAQPRTGTPRKTIAQVSTDWLAGIRFSGFSIIMMGVLVLAVVVLAPSIASYAEQRQQIAELKADVARQEAEVARLTEQRERWNDETYLITQARERLYYVLPGEVSYLVVDDRSPESLVHADGAVSREVTEQEGDWMQTMLRSVMTAGLAPAASDAPAAPDPAEPAPAGTDQPADEGTR